MVRRPSIRLQTMVLQVEEYVSGEGPQELRFTYALGGPSMQFATGTRGMFFLQPVAEWGEGRFGSYYGNRGLLVEDASGIVRFGSVGGEAAPFLAGQSLRSVAAIVRAAAAP